jgi:phosphatidylethanolamine-binding protein (PEBP) family uncharacterized protein
VFQHWAAYNIAPDWTGLIEGYGPETLERGGFHQAINDFNKPGPVPVPHVARKPMRIISASPP